MNKQSDTTTDNAPHNITRNVSVAIIGAGTAGQNAFRQASKIKDDVVIINEGFWTTTCIAVGCMPSKLLIAATSSDQYIVTLPLLRCARTVLKFDKRTRVTAICFCTDIGDATSQMHG